MTQELNRDELDMLIDEVIDDLRPAVREHAKDALIRELVGAYKEAREIILNQRGALEEPCLDGDQINAVLSAMDDCFLETLAKAAAAGFGV